MQTIPDEKKTKDTAERFKRREREASGPVSGTATTRGLTDLEVACLEDARREVRHAAADLTYLAAVAEGGNVEPAQLERVRKRLGRALHALGEVVYATKEAS